MFSPNHLLYSSSNIFTPSLLLYPYQNLKENSFGNHLINNIFGEYKRFVLVYVDDILVFSKDIKEHLGHLQTVFRLFVDNGIIISKKKMEFAKII